jgi:sarcosine oxidase subunit alpha
VLVIGAGVSGLQAALHAARAGAQVVVVDENARSGGSASYQLGGSAKALETLRELQAAVAAEPLIRVFTDTTAVGYYADHWVALIDAQRMTKLRAKAVVVASGAFELPAVFRHNDIPGIMTGGAAQRLINRYAVRPMQTAVALVANSEGFTAVLDALHAGVKVAAVADMRIQAPTCAARDAVRAAGVRVLDGWAIYEAHTGDSGRRVSGVTLARLRADGQADTSTNEHVACDGVIMSVGYAPAANLLYQAGTSMGWSDTVQQFVPAKLPAGIFACGRVNGMYDSAAKALDGQRAGMLAAAHCGFASPQAVPHVPEAVRCPSHPWPIVAHPQGKNFVDFDEDLQLKDFYNAAQEGYDNVELMKRYTTNGMGPSQGKHSNMTALRVLARILGKTPIEVGTTTARPFYHPVPISHLAGRGFTPERHTPMRALHTQAGAIWMAAGMWQRPEYYAVAGRSRMQCIREEAMNVRKGVGIIDVGTLGKLEVIGPQAAEFLERIYISRYANLAVGMTRYAVMCDEAGVVIDDGVVARLAEQHFYFTTTTSGAATVYRELSRLNTLWRMDCGIVNHTGAFAGVNVAGPQARQLLATLTSADLDGAAFPYLGVREIDVAGIPARAMRVGFVGEWGYEVHVPAEFGATLWQALMQAGAGLGIRPFGVEAQRLLRLEKGHIIIGQDTDGLTVPREAALGWATKLDKPFFIGQRSLQAIAKRPQKQTLVGFTLDIPGMDSSQDSHPDMPSESHLVIVDGEISGRITSVAFSPALGQVVGMAFVTPALSAVGTRLPFRLTSGKMVEAQVAALPFYDAAGARQKEASV